MSQMIYKKYFSIIGNTSRKYYIFFTIYAFIFMLFCTKSSPLFVFNDWYDANVYFTMGKGWMNGRVPYVDLIDNKGPLLYLIYGMAWLVDHTGFFGVYLFQSLFAGISIIFTYRLTLLFIENQQIAAFIAVCSPVPMLVHRFYAADYDFGGGGPDEFCRCFMVISLYYFSLYYIDHEKYKPYHTFIQGCLFMGVFLIKFNLIVFWAGFLLSIACELICKKKYKYLLKHLANFTFGAFIVILPYLIYGIVTNSLSAFFHTYFLYNWLYVNPSHLPGMKALEAIFSVIGMIGDLWGFALLFSIGIVFVFFTCKTGFKIGYSISLFLLFTVTYYTSIRFATIHIPLTAALIFGMVALGVFIEQYVRNRKFPGIVSAAAACVVMAITIGVNGLVKYDLFLTDKPAAQQQMAEIIWRETRSGSPTLLEINGLDSGFYTAAGIIPDEPYFFVYNIDHEVYPYPRDAQEKAVTEGHSEFVIASTAYHDAVINPYNIRQLYDEVCVIQGTGYQSGLYYHLFHLKPDSALHHHNTAAEIHAGHMEGCDH